MEEEIKNLGTDPKEKGNLRVFIKKKKRNKKLRRNIGDQVMMYDQKCGRKTG